MRIINNYVGFETRLRTNSLKFEPAAFGLPVISGPLPVISGPLPVISGPVIQRLQVRILWEDNFFYCLFYIDAILVALLQKLCAGSH